MLETGKIINGDCIEVMKTFPEGCVDLVVTSPPYNCGIKYDTHIDTLDMSDYWNWTEQWLTEVYRVLEDDGRVAINIPYEINVKDRGGRVMFMADFWSVMKKVGFKPFGIVDLDELQPHRVKLTAWGSWMSASGPYIYNPKECIILAYKKHHIKKDKGTSQWEGYEEKNENGDIKLKFKDEDKNEFKELVFGQWKYFADTKSLTKATFSMDIPGKAIKILTYKNDIVLDPFMGSGTSAVAAEILDRRWVGIELSPNYTDIATERVRAFVENKKQMVLEFEKGGN